MTHGRTYFTGASAIDLFILRMVLATSSSNSWLMTTVLVDICKAVTVYSVRKHLVRIGIFELSSPTHYEDNSLKICKSQIFLCTVISYNEESRQADTCLKKSFDTHHIYTIDI